MHSLQAKDVGPWYRQPWPWLLMAGPAIVVVAGFITLGLAISANDGLVVDDYYKQGKEVNRSLKRDDAARALGLNATLAIDEARDRVSIDLRAATENPLARQRALRLTLAHATTSGHDQIITLQNVNGVFNAPMRPLTAGKWHALIEDEARTWRLQATFLTGHGAVPPLMVKPPAPPVE